VKRDTWDGEKARFKATGFEIRIHLEIREFSIRGEKEKKKAAEAQLNSRSREAGYQSEKNGRAGGKRCKDS